MLRSRANVEEINKNIVHLRESSFKHFFYLSVTYTCVCISILSSYTYRLGTTVLNRCTC